MDGCVEIFRDDAGWEIGRANFRRVTSSTGMVVIEPNWSRRAFTFDIRDLIFRTLLFKFQTRLNAAEAPRVHVHVQYHLCSSKLAAIEHGAISGKSNMADPVCLSFLPQFVNFNLIYRLISAILAVSGWRTNAQSPALERRKCVRSCWPGQTP